MSLRFGTAGIRGPLGDGPDAMNPATVHRVAMGLGRFLDTEVGAVGGGPARVLVGRDARHGSEVFAHEAAAALASLGHEVQALASPCPTPVLAYGVRERSADAGVMVTASHNPASDNGFKVYLGGRLAHGDENGAPIVSPTDSKIETFIAAEEWGPTSRAKGKADRADGPEKPGEGLVESYLQAIGILVSTEADVRGRRAGLRIVLTPLHGVGGRVAREALERAGFTSVAIVPEQADPDPDFPTVPLPNPEEPGALDRAFAFAESKHADLVLALDPDADRCAVGAVLDGGWRRLTGDEVGCLLGDHIASRLCAGEPLPGAEPGATTFASSFVSSGLLRVIAEENGLTHRETLTGFKWLARVPNLAFAYEEALGYCVAPSLVRDKDGIAAALLVADRVSRLRASGLSVAAAMRRLDARYGTFRTTQVSAPAPPGAAEEIVARLIASPPATLTSSPVIAVDDLRSPGGNLPSTPAVRLSTAMGARIIIRPSGTEAKVKAYLQASAGPSRSPVEDAARIEATLARLASEVSALLRV